MDLIYKEVGTVRVGAENLTLSGDEDRQPSLVEGGLESTGRPGEGSDAPMECSRPLVQPAAVPSVGPTLLCGLRTIPPIPQVEGPWHGLQWGT